jgi:hypothetical protein
MEEEAAATRSWSAGLLCSPIDTNAAENFSDASFF